MDEVKSSARLVQVKAASFFFIGSSRPGYACSLTHDRLSQVIGL